METGYLAAAGSAAGAGISLPVLFGFSGAVLKAAGITIAVAPFFMGICFAIAGGFIALAWTPPTEKITKLSVLFTASFIGVMAALLHPGIPVVKTLPVQAIMGIAGIASRKLVERAKDLNFTLPWKSKDS